MGIVRSITRTHGILSVFIVSVCVGVAAWGLMSAMVPRVESYLDVVENEYDTYLPEITIKNGHASIRQDQPYHIDAFSDEGLVFIIDTREGKMKEAINYLNDAKGGAVLTRDSLIMKNQRQIRIIPLDEFPDITLNGAEIRALIHEYFPMVVKWCWVAVVAYFLFMKPIQILLLSMIPFFGARSYSVDLTYGEALKITTFAMIPPVLLDVFLHRAGTGFFSSFVLYFVLYVGLLILCVWELVKRSRRVPVFDESIHPE